MILYKYYRYSEHLISNLSRSVFWCSGASHFNDIFDCRFAFGSDLTTRQIDELKLINKHRTDIGYGIPIELPPNNATENVCEDFMGQTKTKIQQFLDRFGIVSFSEIPDSLLMWAHYSKDHTGVCIEYEIGPDFRFPPMPVTYSTQYPELDLYGYSTDMVKTVHQILTTKSIEWAYEKEWRLLMPGVKDTEIICPFKTLSVVFGARISAENKGTLMAILNGKGIKFKQATVADTQYKIRIENLDENSALG